MRINKAITGRKNRKERGKRGWGGKERERERGRERRPRGLSFPVKF